MLKKIRGFGIIEIIVAMGIFIIIAATGVTTVLHSYSINRLSQEEDKATIYASQGLEAVRSIRDNNYSNLVNGTHGLDSSSGAWVFSGNNDSKQKYTREIIITDVYRENGEWITQNGGHLDINTKKIISKVTWNFNSSRANEVALTSYLTNWRGDLITYDSCLSYCQYLEYFTGACVANQNQCRAQDGEYEIEGDEFCAVGGPSEDTCCCFEEDPNIPIPTPTPTPNPSVSTCNDYCIDLGTYSQGTCRQNSQKCRQNNEDYQSQGDQYCTSGPSTDTCCCL